MLVTIPQAVGAVATGGYWVEMPLSKLLQYRKRYELLQPTLQPKQLVWFMTLQYRKRYELLQQGEEVGEGNLKSLLQYRKRYELLQRRFEGKND